jgi:outer membrane protein TolC
LNILRLSAFVSLLCFSCFALAGEDSIWYSTNSLNISSLPSLPAGYLITDNQDTCSSIHAQNTLNLSDVANAALCNNPQTREVWANARAQAAQVGIAKSAYLPSVINTIGTNVNASSPRLVTRDNAYSNLNNSLVATYLLYDFGNRDAALENARQLLQAASATQSAAVQTILFAAVTNYYQVQASSALHEFVVCSY